MIYLNCEVIQFKRAYRPFFYFNCRYSLPCKQIDTAFINRFKIGFQIGIEMGIMPNYLLFNQF